MIDLLSPYGRESFAAVAAGDNVLRLPTPLVSTPQSPATRIDVHDARLQLLFRRESYTSLSATVKENSLGRDNFSAKQEGLVYPRDVVTPPYLLPGKNWEP